MLKNALVTATTTMLLLAVLTACAEDDQSSSADNKATDTSKAVASTKKPAGNKAADNKTKRPNRAEMKAPEVQPLEAFQSAPIMGKPVDFSSPESITSSMQAIQKEAGDEALSRVESAVSYMLVYDLSVGRNEQKLHEKLNGKTPNQILAMAGH